MAPARVGGSRVSVTSDERRALFARLLDEAGVVSADDTIPRLNDPRPPLSVGEQQLWLSQALAPDSHAYHTWEAARLRGPLDVEALEASLAEIVRRHENLRASFPATDGFPTKEIAPASGARFQLPVDDLSARPTAERDTAAEEIAHRELRQPFALAAGPLWRARLVKRADDEHLFLWSTHHIVTDGWSRGVFASELAALYQALVAGRATPLPELPIQYGDVAAWERTWLEGPEARRQLAYWQQTLGGHAGGGALPRDKDASGRATTTGGRETTIVPGAVVQQLEQLGREEGATLFMTLLAAFAATLSRRTGETDLAIGTDVANRTRTETEPLIGFFVNHLVLRLDLEDDPPFRELVRRVRDVALEAYAHADVPFPRVVEALQPERRPGRTPLFETLFVLQNLPSEPLRLPGLQVTAVEFEAEASKFDVGLFLEPGDGGLKGTWLYKTDFYNAATIKEVASELGELLARVAADPDQRLGIRSGRERRNDPMEDRPATRPSLAGIRGTRRKAVDLAEVPVVETGRLEGVEHSPLLVTPAADDVNLPDWAGTNADHLERELQEKGSILFRGFDVKGPADVEEVAGAICPELFEEYGDLPREGVSGKIYSSTPYPADQPILFHNEGSHLHRWPLKIWFSCVTPAEQGGETPILDCRRVLGELDPAIRQRFAEQGVMYVRNYTEGLDVSWQDFFHTSDRSEVEDALREASIEWEWKDGDGLRTKEVRRAVARHPKTGDEVFFNQIQLHHPSSLPDDVRESMQSLFDEEDMPRNCYYGDGTPIEDSVMDELNELYRRTSVEFPWQRGDILMLDNMLTAHSRNPYSGPRKVVVTMGELVGDDV